MAQGHTSQGAGSGVAGVALAVVAVLVLAVAAVLGLSGPASCQGDDCLPGTGPTPPTPTPPGPPRCFLPLVVRGGEATPPPACPNPGQEQEPNDTHTDATPFVFSCVRGVAEWDGDSDWYRVRLCSGPWNLTVVLDGPDGANLDLYLYGDPPGWPIASSESGGPDEALSVSGLVTGTYYLLVQPAWGSGPYTLSAEVRR